MYLKLYKFVESQYYLACLTALSTNKITGILVVSSIPELHPDLALNKFKYDLDI